MHKLVPTALALAFAVGTGFAAAETGEADPAGSKGAGTARSTTKAERQQARKQRLGETASENKAGALGPGGERGEASGAAATDGKHTTAERKQARKQRLSETARQNKAGQIQSGETAGSAPAR
jgi:hypothetical protein